MKVKPDLTHCSLFVHSLLRIAKVCTDSLRYLVPPPLSFPARLIETLHWTVHGLE